MNEEEIKFQVEAGVECVKSTQKEYPQTVSVLMEIMGFIYFGLQKLVTGYDYRDDIKEEELK